MRIISTSSPSPRLLNTVASDVTAKKTERPTGRFSLKRASLFSGNGRAIFVGIVVGAVIFTILGVVYTGHQSRKKEIETVARVTPVSTPDMPSAGGADRPPPIWASQIQISGIALGEPRLAIVNGKQVMEGQEITISIPNESTAVRLRVEKIADGQVDLSDGTRVITLRLETSRAPNRKP